MKQWGIILAAACAFSSGAAAQPESMQQRGKRVVEAALQALGGDAFLKMEDRMETGRAYSFFREQLQGLSVATIYTRYLPPVPGKPQIRERDAFGKKQDEGVLLFTETGAWDITFRGARPLEDLRFQNYQDSTLRNIFYILHSRLNEPGLTFYSQGSDRFENQPVEIVDITDSSTQTVTVYFSQSTKLPVRQSFRRRNPMFNDFDTEVTIFAKFRDVGGGAKWPFDIRRERNGQKIYEMFSESVEINKSLPDNLFSLAADIKILPKPK